MSRRGVDSTAGQWSGRFLGLWLSYHTVRIDWRIAEAGLPETATIILQQNWFKKPKFKTYHRLIMALWLLLEREKTLDRFHWNQMLELKEEKTNRRLAWRNPKLTARTKKRQFDGEPQRSGRGHIKDACRQRWSSSQSGRWFWAENLCSGNAIYENMSQTGNLLLIDRKTTAYV